MSDFTATTNTASASPPIPDPLAPPRKDEDTGAAALIESTRRIQDHASGLVKELGAAFSGARHFLEKSIEQRPATTLGVAAGAGYVIAGGLSSSFTKLALKTGTKLATAWVIKEITEAATGTEIKVDVEKKD